MLRIGYDAKRLFTNFTGLGNYSRTLLANLAQYHPEHAYFLYTPRVVKNEETNAFLNSAMYNVQLPKRGLGSWWRSWGVRRELKRHHVDLYHGLSHEIPYQLSRISVKSVVTIHDLIFKHLPHHYARADRLIYDLKFRYACERADHVVAISESTKRDIIYYYNIPAEKISVIYQSCHERYMQELANKTLLAVRKKYQLPEDYMLYVGSITERKNLMGIVQAMAELPKDQRLPLVAIGRGGSYKQKVVQYLKKQQLAKCVQFVAADFDDLPAIYQGSSLFLYPSLYEGFGIPILEALFSRVPVITSQTSSLPEAAGPGAALVDPANSSDIAQTILRILDNADYRQQLIDQGYQHAQQFRGEPLAQQMMELYQSLTGHYTPLSEQTN